MATRAIGPKLIIGTVVGVVIGLMAALISIYIAGAAILLGLYMLGRYAPNSSVAEAHARAERWQAEQRERRQWLDAQAKRNAYWLRFPLGGIPGEQRNGRHLDRAFMPYTECDQGHYDMHHLGRFFVRDGADRVARSCAAPDCTCTWSELLIGGVE